MRYTQRGFAPVLIIIVLVLILVAIVGYFFLQTNGGKQQAFSQLSPTPASTVRDQPSQLASPTLTTSNATGWNIYTNSSESYRIKYPNKLNKKDENWVYREYTQGYSENQEVKEVYFGTPSSAQGGYIWGVSVYDNENLEDLIKQQGRQFDDREESRQNITVNGVPVLLVTVTTNRFDDWISKMVYIEKGKKIYTITNGAVDRLEFDYFYNSFEFIN